MFVNAFIERQEKPTDSELGEILGPAKAFWDKLVAEAGIHSLTSAPFRILPHLRGNEHNCGRLPWPYTSLGRRPG